MCESSFDSDRPLVIDEQADLVAEDKSEGEKRYGITNWSSSKDGAELFNEDDGAIDGNVKENEHQTKCDHEIEDKYEIGDKHGTEDRNEIQDEDDSRNGNEDNDMNGGIDHNKTSCDGPICTANSGATVNDGPSYRAQLTSSSSEARSTTTDSSYESEPRAISLDVIDCTACGAHIDLKHQEALCHNRLPVLVCLVSTTLHPWVELLYV